MPVPSPCNKICTMDPKSGLCFGCRRTLTEIATWGGMTDEERKATLEAVDARYWPVSDQPSGR